jgi:hypothetical protein
MVDRAAGVAGISGPAEPVTRIGRGEHEKPLGADNTFRREGPRHLSDRAAQHRAPMIRERSTGYYRVLTG